MDEEKITDDMTGIENKLGKQREIIVARRVEKKMHIYMLDGLGFWPYLNSNMKLAIA